MPERTSHKIRDSRIIKDFLVFLIFLVVAALFWLILSLNDDAIQSYKVSLKIKNVPDSISFNTAVPNEIDVKVKGRGMNLFKFTLTGDPELRLDYDEFVKEGKLHVSNENLVSSLNEVFGASSNIVSVHPDSISLKFHKIERPQ